MKRPLVVIIIILLVGGVIYEEKHRAASIKNHLPPVTLKDPASMPYLVKDSNFSDSVDLWGNPGVKTPEVDLDYARIAFQESLRPAQFEKFQSKLGYKTEPVLTVLDRQVAYSLVDLGGFKLHFNLKPGYPNPEAILPSRVDPGISGSFSF